MTSSVATSAPHSSHLNGGEQVTPVINVHHVSVDGQEHAVPMRQKKTPTAGKLSVKKDDNQNDTTPRSSIAQR